MEVKQTVMHLHRKPVTCIKYNKDGDVLFSTSKEKDGIAAWDTETGKLLGTYEGGHKAIASCDVNNATTLLATAGSDLKVNVWDVLTGESLLLLDHAAPIRSVGFAHDDSLLFSTMDGKMGNSPTLYLHKLPTEFNKIKVNVDKEFAGKFMAPNDILFAEWGPTNDTIYLANEGGSVSIMDVETEKEILRVNSHTDDVRKIHFDSNYMTLITASKDKTSKLLDSRCLKTITTYKSDVPINDASISPISDHVLLGGGTEAQDVTTTGGSSNFDVKFYHKIFGGSTPLATMKCHFGTINSVAYHPSGKSFASGSVDGFVKFHNIVSGIETTPGYIPHWTYNDKN